MLKDFLDLFYPNLCFSCQKPLVKGENDICLHCLVHLPFTNWHKELDNPLAQKLKGRMPIVTGTAYLFFDKGETVQNMLHRLKYKNQQQIGFKIGQMLGNSLLESSFYKGIDVIIPVPLHVSREKRRQYNQSAVFANGIADRMKIDVCTSVIYRKVNTTTQTKKERYSRWENMENVFELTATSSLLENKSILLVDDVITTGSTLEACTNRLLEINGVKVSIATIATA